MMANVDYTRLMWITIINNNITGPNVLPILCCEPIQKGWYLSFSNIRSSTNIWNLGRRSSKEQRVHADV